MLPAGSPRKSGALLAFAFAFNLVNRFRGSPGILAHAQACDAARADTNSSMTNEWLTLHVVDSGTRLGEGRDPAFSDGKRGPSLAARSAMQFAVSLSGIFVFPVRDRLRLEAATPAGVGPCTRGMWSTTCSTSCWCVG